MVTDELLDKLRHKSEGADLDFKRAQYSFNKESREAKSELLKDILAMANAWRDGPGYILIGFDDKTPHPAEVVGISDANHIDDASLQQFVNSKVEPKLEFRYEERRYEGKRIAVITVPKQRRPFSLAAAYGALKSNVAYVRRGSSTDEARLEEVVKMANEDAGKGHPDVELLLANENDEPLQCHSKMRFLRWNDLPDFCFDSGGLHEIPPRVYPTANEDYWRDAADYFTSRGALIQVRIGLSNHSSFTLTYAKLELKINALDGQAYRIMLAGDLPYEPDPTLTGSLSTIRFARASQAEMLNIGTDGTAHARLGNLLPGECGWAEDLVAIIPDRPGKLQIHVRILASELPQPLVREHTVEAAGLIEELNVENLQEMLDAYV